jgi:hypothetical protein
MICNDDGIFDATSSNLTNTEFLFSLADQGRVLEGVAGKPLFFHYLPLGLHGEIHHD